MKLKNLLIPLIGGILTLVTLTSCIGENNAVSESQKTIEEEIKIGGSSEGYPIMEILADAYENDSIEVTLMPNSQSSGGIRGVQDGVINIGVISQEITITETPENVKYIPVVKNFVVLITNENVQGVSNLNTEQIKGIYNGTITNWKEVGGPDAEIVLLDIAEDETEKEVFREHYIGKNFQITSKAIIFQDDDLLLEGIKTTPYSIGIISNWENLKEDNVNILSIDNVAPNKVNIQNGKYKMTQTIGIVFSPQPTSGTQEFIDFLLSQKGKEALESTDYIVENN
ncbi:substrate-binding domain-containing protein [Okeania sp.]|uniref:substrate-binding domain-containing protein n=1 Tax=Okeania sp. TaxID=3100323 RepID=UPI002B4B2B68|nr:substrate-binding domain-containing protein [Okeania sp.]MEB3340060.1 substrate-binding domain-containing protein [Okeania sp.]